MTRRIGILTSGGDCAGLNAVLRAAVLHAVGRYGWTVYRVHKGTAGLMSRPVEAEVLEPARFDGTFLRQAGTILGTTNKGNPFAYPLEGGGVEDRSAEVIAGYRELGLDALIGIGGDGSLAILRRLAQQGGINLVGIPKTIGLTEVAIGHASAVEVATDALDHLQPTAASHDRVMVLEVMGRDAGHIALTAGIAGGADIILIPEIDYSIASVAEKIESLRAAGRNFALVVVAEAIKSEKGESFGETTPEGKIRYGGIGHYIGERICEETGAETRVMVLGHLQRGGTPVSRDRLMASVFGVHAVDLIAAERYDRMVAWMDRKVVDAPLDVATATYHAVDPNGPLVHTARGLGISFGDGG